MFPKWFDRWNRDNPTNIYGPAVAVGIVGAAVFVATVLITWGQPYATASLQTGPRGTGMDYPKFKAELATPDPTREMVYDNPPIPPEPGDPLAKDVYKNVQVLGDLTEANFTRLMASMSEWVAPDQGCAYCHGDGGMETYSQDTLYTKKVARRMLQMTRNINANWAGHVNANKQVGVTCFTCHRGQHVPSDIWFKITPVNHAASGWSAVQNRATSQSQFTSLPSSALENYLLDTQTIAVSDTEARVKGVPGKDVASIQQTEQTYSLMNYIDNSLGVKCVFCHNTRAFYSAAGQMTPQWGTAMLGIQMVQELNNEYLLGIKTWLPAKRLGPVHQDVPKAACRTCHKGYQQPLQGLNVIKDWPELATEGAPDYGSPGTN